MYFFALLLPCPPSLWEMSTFMIPLFYKLRSNQNSFLNDATRAGEIICITEKKNHPEKFIIPLQLLIIGIVTILRKV